MKLIDKVKEKAKSLKTAVVAVGSAVVMGASSAVFASATANTALTDAASSTAAQIQADVNAVIPIALGLMALVLGVTIGIRVFRSLAKAGTRG